MGVFNLFNRKKREKRSFLMQILAMAMADGRLANEELLAIHTICNHEGITEDEIQFVSNNLDSIEYVIPKDESTKRRYLSELVAVMVADGVIDDAELKFAKIIAKSFGFHPTVIDELAKHLLSKRNESV